MHLESALPVILAQDPGSPTGEDLKRDAGLRGEQFSNAVLGLSTVFALGLIVLVIVVLKGRRRRERP